MNKYTNIVLYTEILLVTKQKLKVIFDTKRKFHLWRKIPSVSHKKM